MSVVTSLYNVSSDARMRKSQTNAFRKYHVPYHVATATCTDGCHLLSKVYWHNLHCFIIRESVLHLGDVWTYNFCFYGLTMAGNVPPPPMFLPCSGETQIPFSMWMPTCSLLMQLEMPGLKLGREQLYSIASELRDNGFSTYNQTRDTFLTGATALEKYFTPKVNVVVERHTFRHQKQAAHETVVQYVAPLHELPRYCERFLQFHLCCDLLSSKPKLFQQVIVP